MPDNQYSSRWVLCTAPASQAPLRLFCFPYAGGGASTFRDWPVHLASLAETCPVQLPGRENRLKEAPITQMHVLVEAIASALLPYMDDKPFALFGHSMGALLCYELARFLWKNYTLSPACLFVSGCRAPHRQSAYLNTSRKRVCDLSDSALMEWMHQLNGTSQTTLQDDELMSLLLPGVRADFTLAETYAFIEDGMLDCPLSVFGGIQDEQIKRDDLLDWLELTSGPSVTRMLPGDHFFLRSSQHLLLNAIRHDLMSLA
jgi:medium-chain acyl-[acyl-carrier-protein] hydrolase